MFISRTLDSVILATAMRSVSSSRSSNQRISKRLFLSQATVKSHLVHIYGKLGVDSRTAAVAVAVDRGLIRR